MKKILVSGSIAYDDIEAVDTNELRRFYGGCSANISYNLNLIGTPFVMHGIVGKDFNEYEKWLKKNKISTRYLLKLKNKNTCHASVKNTGNGKQLVKFSHSTGNLSAFNLKKIKTILARVCNDIAFAIIAPDSVQVMSQVATACNTNGLPYFFDPGPVTPLFTKANLQKLISKSVGLFANEDEIRLILKQTGWSMAHLRNKSPLIITTLGSKGSQIYTAKKIIKINPVKSKRPNDPTGCGDAYRAGFLSELVPSFPAITEQILKRAGAKGSRLGTKCLESIGTQNHTL